MGSFVGMGAIPALGDAVDPPRADCIRTVAVSTARSTKPPIKAYFTVMPGFFPACVEVRDEAGCEGSRGLLGNGDPGSTIGAYLTVAGWMSTAVCLL